MTHAIDPLISLLNLFTHSTLMLALSTLFLVCYSLMGLDISSMSGDTSPAPIGTVSQVDYCSLLLDALALLPAIRRIFFSRGIAILFFSLSVQVIIPLFLLLFALCAPLLGLIGRVILGAYCWCLLLFIIGYISTTKSIYVLRDFYAAHMAQVYYAYSGEKGVSPGPSTARVMAPPQQLNGIELTQCIGCAYSHIAYSQIVYFTYVYCVLILGYLWL